MKKIYRSEQELYDYALGALGRRMRTVAELKRLLRTKVEAGESGETLIERVVERLKQYKFLNDTQYAATYTRLRQDNNKHGMRRVRQDLMIRGVHADVIEKTLNAAYQDVPEDELARQFLQRKHVAKPTSQKETARIMRMLARAGYSTGAIYRALRALKVQEEVLEDIPSDDAEVDS